MFLKENLLRMRSISLHWYLLCAVTMMLVAFAIRMTAISQTSFGFDEVYTMQTIQKTFYGDGFVQGMRDRLVHMPLYFASLLLYPPPTSDFSIRFPSVLWSILTIAVTMRIMTHIYHDRYFALLAGVLLAINLFNIDIARTARMYPMSNFLVATGSYFFLRYMSNSENRKLHWFGAHFVAMLAYLTHVATLILLVGQALTWLRDYLEKKVGVKHIVYWFSLQLILLLPAVIWAITIFTKNLEENALWWTSKPTFIYALGTLQELMLGDTTTHTLFLLLPLYIIPFISLFLFFNKIKYAEYWIGLTLIPFIGVFVVSQISSIFATRYLGVALFAYIITAVLAYRELLNYVRSQRWHKSIISVFVSGLIALYIITTILFTIRLYRIDYFSWNFVKQASDYINTHGQTGDAVWYKNQSSHINHYLTDNKFTVIEDRDIERNKYLESDRFSYDRVWVVDVNGAWLGTSIDSYEPLYDHRGTRVYLVKSEEK